MTKARNRLTTLLLCGLLVAASAVVLLCGGAFYRAGAAYDATPTEFGAEIERVISGGDTYINYKYGYEKLGADGEVTATAAGYNAVAGQTFAKTKISADVMAETVAMGGVNVEDKRLESVYGAGWGQDAADKIKKLFRDKYKEVYASGVPGIATGDVETWGSAGAVIKQEYRYGESTANPDAGKGGNVNNSAIIYSRRLDKAFFLKDGFMHEYSSQDRARALGAPLTGEGEFTLSGGGYVSSAAQPASGGFATELAEGVYTAMIFEKGVIVKNGDNYVSYIGGVFKLADNEYRVMPFIRDQDIMGWKTGASHAMNFIGDLDGQWHPIIDVYTSYDGEAAEPYSMKVNFKGGCLDITYSLIEDPKENSLDDGKPQAASAMRYAARNFDKNGELVRLPYSAVSSEDYIFGEVENKQEDEDMYVAEEAVSYFKNYQPSGTAADIKSIFTAAYKKYYDAGRVVGYRTSSVKMWDLCVLDFKFGDGSVGFDATGSGGRERMTTLVLNPVKKQAFAVYDAYFNIFKNDSGYGRKTLGYPVTDVLKDKEVEGRTFAEIQIFEKGYVYKAANGLYQTVTGVLYNETENKFTPTPAPTVYSQYGAPQGEPAVKDGAYYINYENGAVKATLNAKGNHFFYDYYHGRNFNDELTAELLPMENFISAEKLSYSGDLPSDGNGNTANFEDIKKELLATYQKIYDTGFFPGFMEEDFKGGWNSVYAQQLILSDSSADIFGESRPGVSALVYNSGKVYFMTGPIIKVWQSGERYDLFRAPTSDEFTIEGQPYVFQTFENGLAIRLGGVAFMTGDYGTPQDYIDNLPNYSVPDYDKDGKISMKK